MIAKRAPLAGRRKAALLYNRQRANWRGGCRVDGRGV